MNKAYSQAHLLVAHAVDEQAHCDGECPGDDLSVYDEAAARAVHVQERLLHEVLDDRRGATMPPQVARESRLDLVVYDRERGVVASRVPLHRAIGRIAAGS